MSPRWVLIHMGILRTLNICTINNRPEGMACNNAGFFSSRVCSTPNAAPSTASHARPAAWPPAALTATKCRSGTATMLGP